MARVGGIVVGLFDAVFRPSRLVAAQTGRGRQSLATTLRQLYVLGVVYFVNVVLYAAPLTLAGVGNRGVGAAPPTVRRLPVANPDVVWQFTVGLVVNSLTLLGHGTISVNQGLGDMRFENVREPTELNDVIAEQVSRAAGRGHTDGT